MGYFFRSVKDGEIIKMFEPLHTIMLAIFLIGIILMIIYKKNIRENKKLDKIIKYGLTAIISSVIVMLYSWYYFAKYVGIKESLPLYHCRMLMILAVVYTIMPKKVIRAILVNLGIIGVTLALAVPVNDPFKFPHITHYTFFAGHMALGWYIAHLIISEKYKFEFEDLKIVTTVSLLYNFVLVLININIGSNYGFLLKPPVLKNVLGSLPLPIYISIIMALFMLLNVLVYIIGRGIQKRLTRAKGN